MFCSNEKTSEMSKRKSSSQKLTDLLSKSEFNDTFCITNESEANEELYCCYCKVNIRALKFCLDKHLNTESHKQMSKREKMKV